MDRALILKPKGGSEAGTERSAERRSDETEREPALFCRSCGIEIAEHRALFCMRADSAVQVFPNPYGQMRVILTLMWARSILVSGVPTTEFTWFAGYAWSIASCAGCAAHLGWRFEAVLGEEPTRFYGLLREAVVDR